MPSWFSKVFKEDEAPATPGAAPLLEDDFEEEEESYRPRRVVNAPVLVEEEELSGWSPEVRIKAKGDDFSDTCTFLIDRPVLEGLSFWCPDRDTANTHSPLAAALFDLGGVSSVLLHDMTVTVQREDSSTPWEAFAKEAGAQIRAQLKSGIPVLHPDYVESIPDEDTIREQLQGVIDREINPGIASHSGLITLHRVQGNTAYITMGGGCQGCAASTITLRQGIESAFRAAVPQLGALLDETDHSAGSNPFFRELPAGMGG
jgi:Fe-S cluster biogenesis protein NfuA